MIFLTLLLCTQPMSCWQNKAGGKAEQQAVAPPPAGLPPRGAGASALRVSLLPAQP